MRKNHISVPEPEGGFYLFPNFEYYREKLIEKDIITSVEMCDRILNETGVAMLPGKDFGRQPEELTVRIAYVDFDGEAALNAAMQIPVDKSLSEKFLKTHCLKMIRAVDLLRGWFNAL